jgi:hypothetical protein
VPYTVSDACLVRVDGMAMGDPSDVSDAVFAIDYQSGVRAPRVPLATGITGFGPNPVAGMLTMELGVAEQLEVSVEVYSATGRLVRRLARGTHRPGYYRIVWDCTDGTGKSTTAGLYMVLLRLGDTVHRRMVSVVR